jgi:head-tail adaptor
MIASGQLNKFIAIEHLKIERDEYGSDIEKWKVVHKCKCNVKGSDSSSLITQNDEIAIQPRLLFTLRKFPAFDIPNHYRIIYNRKKYIVLNINDEDRDTITILANLYNE